MQSSREVRAALLALAAVIVVGSPASAHHQDGHVCTGEAGVIGGSGSASEECQDEDDGGDGDVRMVGDTCHPDSVQVETFGPPPADLVDFYRQVDSETPPPDGFVHWAGFNCAGLYVGGPHLVADRSWGDTVAARERAVARVTPAFPSPHVSPSEAVVHTATWLWVEGADWSIATATETDGAVTVTVSAEPVGIVWELGEGTRRCDGPGRRWTPAAQAVYETAASATRDTGDPACTFTFEHSSTVQPQGVHRSSVTVTWEFSWVANGIDRGVFGTVERTTGFDVRVGEVQALVTGY